MCTKNDAEKIIDNCLNKERLRKIIMKTSIVAWNTSISDTAIDRWLSNYTGRYFSSIELEQKLALWMLAHFTYYSTSDVRVLCKDLFNLLLHQKLIENKNVKSFDDVLNELITDSLFVGLGNASESGQSILYYFRQENKLSKKCFEPQIHHKYKNLIFLDDVSMSGSQACNYIDQCNISSENTYVGFLIATEEAMNKIKETEPDIIPISTMVLDKRDRAFCKESFVFSDPKVKDILPFAKEFCYEYGKIAVEDEQYMKDWPLGFSDGAYLIGFEYNTPDNTLPIFWGTSNNWKPLFMRYEKIYGNGKESAIDGRKYY